MKNKIIFLGGTCNGSNWRNELIPLLEINYFNPVVENWTLECQKEELKQREICDYCLYIITPKMTGFYSIAEVVDDSNKRPEKTIFCVLLEDEGKYGTFYDWSNHQLKSLEAIKKMIISNGAKVFNSLEEVANYVNN